MILIHTIMTYCRNMFLLKFLEERRICRQVPTKVLTQSSKIEEEEGGQMFAYCYDVDGRRAFITSVLQDVQETENKIYFVPKRISRGLVAVDGKTIFNFQGYFL